MWDTGAPNLHHLGDYLNQPSDPYNPWEPVDSSAAAIAAQGLIRWAITFNRGAQRVCQDVLPGRLTVLSTLLEEPYLSVDPKHRGCTPSTIAQMVGIMCPEDKKFLVVKVPCGGITIFVSVLCWCSAWPNANLI